MSKIEGGLHCKQGKVVMDFKISKSAFEGVFCPLVPIFFVSFESESSGPHGGSRVRILIWGKI